MPEGDTLRRLATAINDRFANDVVERSMTRDPRLVGVDLTGRTLTAADAYGKHLFVRFDDGRSLHTHLLMTGSFVVGPPSREPEWKRRVELWLGRGRLTGQSVPLLGMLPTADEHTLTDHLGPDLCAVAGPPDPADIAALLRRQPDEPLAGALLDQRHVAGFGNLYVNEVPFIAGVNPAQPVGSIEGLADLVAIGIALIRANAERGPQNTTGKQLHKSAKWLHGVRHRLCPVCGTRLDRWSERDSPWGRVTTWCSTCQPLDGSAVADLNRTRQLIGLHPAVKQAGFPRQ